MKAGPAVPSIAAYPDGPLIVRGDAEIRDEAGAVVSRGRTVALCRCGISSIKPFCDGTHKLSGFSTGDGEQAADESAE